MHSDSIVASWLISHDHNMVAFCQIVFTYIFGRVDKSTKDQFPGRSIPFVQLVLIGGGIQKSRIQNI